VLYAETAGVGGGCPVVLLHGFTQSGAAWEPINQVLRAGHQVTVIDAPGHGRSAGVDADLLEGADLMVEVAPPAASWVGYSMGGRFALQVALRHPARVSRLVLVSTSAGIDDPAERAARVASDAALAEQAETAGLEPFVRAWLEQPLFASLASDRAALESRLQGTAAGLASSLRRAGAGAQPPVWDRLHQLGPLPTLVVAGAKDQKYVGLARRLVTSIGSSARMEIIEGAGHACHLEQPEKFLAVVGPFLDAG
jgi:2-succinyl-6-hydroxy-2,4-cyclohexadiene-1-carboxylate synthase